MKRIYAVIIQVFLLSFALFLLAPFIVISVTSFAKRWFGTAWLPEEFSLEWYSWAWKIAEVPMVMFNSLSISFMAVFISLIIAIPTSWALAKRNIKHKEVWLSLFLLPRMIPPLAFALGIAKVFYAVDLIDTYMGVALAHVTVCAPYCILILTSTFEGLDHRIMDAASVCGATPLQTFFKITLPLTMPGILSAMIFAFTTSYNEFTLTIMTYGPKTMTLPIKTYLAIGDGFWEVASAISIILLVPSLIILFIIQSKLKPEKLMGGFKGI